MTSHDLFGDRAGTYARHRPTYPDALFDHLVEVARGHHLAWDCGTGSGQSARGLAARFQTVVATDSSVRQLREAVRDDRVR